MQRAIGVDANRDSSEFLVLTQTHPIFCFLVSMQRVFGVDAKIIRVFGVNANHSSWLQCRRLERGESGQQATLPGKLTHRGIP